MIVHKVEQRSAEWYQLRWGRITGSAVKDLLSGPVGHQSMYERLSMQRANPEGWTEEYERGFDNEAMRWGRKHEDTAVSNLELDKFVTVDRGPVIESSDVPLLVSLDGLTEENVPVEIKCPYNPSVHLNYLANGMGNHNWQLLAGMIVTGACTGIFMSYDPREQMQKCYYQTLERDQVMAARVMESCISMNKMVESGKYIPFIGEQKKSLEGIPQLF